MLDTLQKTNTANHQTPDANTLIMSVSLGQTLLNAVLNCHDGIFL